MNPGVNLANWIQTNVAALFAAALGILGLIVLAKRKIMAGVILLVIAGLGALFVFKGSDLAQKLSDIVMYWFKD